MEHPSPPASSATIPAPAGDGAAGAAKAPPVVDVATAVTAAPDFAAYLASMGHRPATHPPAPSERDPALDALVREIIARIADKWTMLVLETLEEHGTLRFTQLADRIGDVSQKMLTKTLRQMEADGLVTRTVHPVIPPRVDYVLTEMGRSLGAAFCGVWLWAEYHRDAIATARAAFADTQAAAAK